MEVLTVGWKEDESMKKEMSEIQKAIDWFQRRKDMGLSDRCQNAENTALNVLQAQAEREKGCEYCNEEKSFEIHYDGEKAGRAWLHKSSDGWALFLEIDGEPIFYINVNACPVCGRDLRKPVEK